MKKFLSVILTLCMLFVSADAFAFTNITESTDGWTVDASPEGSAGAELRSDGYHVYFDTTAEAAKASVMAKREYTHGGGAVFALSAGVMISGTDENITREIGIYKGLINRKPVSVKGNVLSFFGDEAATIEENTMTDIFVSVDIENDTGYLWINGELTAQADGVWRTQFTGASSEIRVINKLGSAAAAASDFVIKDMVIGDGSADTGISFTSSPADGAAFVDSSIPGIDIDFGGLTNSANISESNITLTEDGTEVDVDIIKSGSVYTVAPINGFSGLKTYELAFADIVDLLGTSQGGKSISFSTTKEGHIPPSMELTTSGAKAFVGDTITVNAQISGSEETERVEYKLNGADFDTVTEGDFSCDFALDKGSYTVSAVAYDILGGASSEESINIEFIENTAPVVAISFPSEGESYDMSDDFTSCGISASDAEDNLSTVTVTVNGEIAAESADSSFAADISGFIRLGENVLTVTAVDELGLTGTKTVTFKVDGSDEINEFANESFDSGSHTKLGSYVANSSSVAPVIKVVEGSGNDTPAYVYEGSPAGGAYLNMATQNVKTHLKVYFDLYFGSVPGGCNLYYGVSASGGNLLFDLVNFTGSTAKIAGQSNIAYKAQTWYNCIFDVDLAERVLSFTLDDPMDGEPAATYSMPITNDKVTNGYIRFNYAAEGGTENILVALDNVRYVELTKPPVLEGVSTDGATIADTLPSGTKLYAHLTSGLDSESLTKENVEVSALGDKLAIDSVALVSDEIVEITLKEPLRTAVEHQVTIKAGTIRINGKPTDTDLTKSFGVEPGIVDVKNVKFIKNGDNVKLSGVFVHNEDGEVGGLGVLTVYRGSEMQSISITPLSAGSFSAQSFTTGSLPMESGDTAEFVVIRSIAEPEFITSAIYTMN